VILSESVSLVMMFGAICVRWYCLCQGLTWAYEGIYGFAEFAVGFICFVLPGGGYVLP
jgi:hypothetical protein